ncbi:Rne/Rng family ribonuclease, partial [bacterium]|nr:Rne/Rng family ribonuclease [bacterium]
MKTTNKKTTRRKTTPKTARPESKPNPENAEQSASASSGEAEKKRPSRRGRRGGVGRKRPASKTEQSEAIKAAETTSSESPAPAESKSDDAATEKKRPSRRGRRGGVGRKRPASKTEQSEAIKAAEPASSESPTPAESKSDDAATEKKRPSRRGRRGGVGRKRPASKTEPTEATKAAETTSSESPAPAETKSDDAATEKKRPSRRGRRGGVGRKRPASKTETTEAIEAAEPASSESPAPAETKSDDAATEKKRPSRRGRRGGVGRKRPASKTEPTEAIEAAKEASKETIAEPQAKPEKAASQSKRASSRRKSSSKQTSNKRQPEKPAQDKAPHDVQTKTSRAQKDQKSKPRPQTGRSASSKKPLCRMIFAEESSYSIAVITEDGQLTDFWVEEEHIVDRGAAGNIYRGVVSKVIPALQAAFVDIGLDKDGFLSFQEMGPEVYKQRKASGNKRIEKIEDALRPGDKVLVQMAKEAIGDKGPALTSKVSMPGRFLIYMPYAQVVRMSRMLSDKERKALYELAEQEIGTDGGLIFRTAAADRNADEIRQDLQSLTGKWKEIQREFEAGSNPKCLHREPKLFERVLRDHFSSSVDEVVLYHPRLKFRIADAMKKASAQRDPNDCIRFYEKTDQSIWKAYNLTKDIDHLFSKIVRLDCGGYIIIEEMETLTAIDVNSGKNISGKDFETMISETNQQAAVEVARQMRLRQLGGIIIVDFIDMQQKRNQDRVFKIIERELAKDRTPTDLQEFTNLGLV